MTCSSQNDDATLLANAKIVEASLFDTVSTQLYQNQSLDYVLVTEMCNRAIPNHSGISKTIRLLQASDLSDVRYIMEVSQICVSCGDEAAVASGLFEDVEIALNAGINDGNLTRSIQTKSQGTIDAVVEPNSTTSSYSIKSTVPPTSLPTPTPTRPGTPRPSSKPSGDSIKTKQPTSKTSKEPTVGGPSKTPNAKSSKRSSHSPVENGGKSSKTSSKSSKPTKESKKGNTKKKRIPLLVSEGNLVSMDANQFETSDGSYSSFSTPSLAPTGSIIFEAYHLQTEEVQRKKHRGQLIDYEYGL